MKVAIFGSRKGVDLEQVGTYLSARFRPDITLVSGGADGVDRYAEQTWVALGGRVVSLRPHLVGDDEWGVERWEFGGVGQPFVIPLISEPTWADLKGAAFYRDLLIAEEGDRGVAWQYRRSRGTQTTIDAFAAEEKPCVVKRFE